MDDNMAYHDPERQKSTQSFKFVDAFHGGLLSTVANSANQGPWM